MLEHKDYCIMKHAVVKHGDDFWKSTKIVDDREENNIFLVEDVEEALEKEGYELVLRKKE